MLYSTCLCCFGSTKYQRPSAPQSFCSSILLLLNPSAPQSYCSRCSDLSILFTLSKSSVYFSPDLNGLYLFLRYMIRNLSQVISRFRPRRRQVSSHIWAPWQYEYGCCGKILHRTSSWEIKSVYPGTSNYASTQTMMFLRTSKSQRTFKWTSEHDPATGGCTPDQVRTINLTIIITNAKKTTKISSSPSSSLSTDLLG